MIFGAGLPDQHGTQKPVICRGIFFWGTAFWAAKLTAANSDALRQSSKYPLLREWLCFEQPSSMEDPTPPLDTPEVVGGLKTRLFQGPKSI